MRRTTPPFFSENFEGDAHQFTIVNGTQTNQWHVGTATANGGSKSAYVSNDEGITNAYTISATSVVYMYVDVEFPASSSEKPYFLLSFDWMGVGEGTYDNLSVCVAETSNTPTAGNDFYFGTTFARLMGKDAWQQGKVDLPQSYAGTTKRLLFTWKNNGSGGGQPSMAVDNIALTASSSYTSSGITGACTWELNITDSTLTISGSGAMPNYNSSNQPWYSYSSSIKSVIVAEGITTIGDYAFDGCINLSSVSIPSSVSTIGDYAFFGCGSLTSVVLPYALTRIGGGAFGYCSALTSVTIPSGVTNIGSGSYVFHGCAGLRELVVLNPQPVAVSFGNVNKTACVLKVGTNAESRYRAADEWKDFSNIEGSGYTVSAIPNLTVWGSVSGVEQQFYAEDAVLNLTATPAAGCRFISWTARSSGELISTSSTLAITVATNDTLLMANFERVVAVDLTAAGTLRSKLTDAATISSLTVTGIIDACDVQLMRDSMPLLKTLDLSGATIASYSGTAGTNYGEAVSYPANEMPQYSFYNKQRLSGKASLTSIELPSSLTSIGTYAFTRCSGLRSIAIPSSVTTIVGYAFYECSLTSVTIPESVTTIGSYAFFYSGGITAIEVAEANPSYASQDGVLFNKSKSTLILYPAAKAGSSYVIPNSVTTISGAAFSNCSGLISVSIPEGVTNISTYTFFSCRGLSSVTIPSGVTSIGTYAFYNCTGLTELVALNPQPVAIATSVFSGVNKSSCVLKVPTASASLYEAAAVWTDFTSIEGSGYTVSAIPNLARLGSVSGVAQQFYAKDAVLNLTATPATGGNFVSWTVRGSGQVISTNPILAITVTKDSFLTANFERVAVVNLTTAGTLSSELSDAATVSHLTVTGSIDARDVRFMRDNMPSLVDVNLSGATVAAYSGTAGTEYGEDKSYPANVMPQLSFEKKISLTAIALPSSLTGIGDKTLDECNNLRSVTIPEGVTTIGSNAFYNCSGLTELVALNPSPVVINANVFTGVNKSSCVLKVLEESVSLYKNATGWKDLTKIEGIATYTVTFSSQEGSEVALQTVADGGMATEPIAPTKQGYTFGGWYREADCTNEWDFAADMVTRDTTLYAQWHEITLPKYTVTITTATNGAIVVKNGTAAVTSGASLDSGTVLTLQATPNAGYTFTEWWDGSIEANREFKLQADVTIAVTFTEQVTPQPTTYTVTFNSQGGSSVTAQTVEHGSKVPQPTAPTKPGYTFGGWYMEQECLNAWSFNTAITSNLTLYAKWTPEEPKPTAVAANELLPLKLYPTVTNGELTVENGEWGGVIASEAKQAQAIEVYNLSGVLVAKVPTTGEKTTINISQLPGGTYIVRVGRYAGKVVKK